jgi:hypothetical protein
VDSAAKLERILGPGWETLTGPQVTARARELEQETAFVWQVQRAMWRQQAATVGAVFSVAQDDATD